jgi:hypothetical protein
MWLQRPGHRTWCWSPWSIVPSTCAERQTESQAVAPRRAAWETHISLQQRPPDFSQWPLDVFWCQLPVFPHAVPSLSEARTEVVKQLCMDAQRLPPLAVHKSNTSSWQGAKQDACQSNGRLHLCSGQEVD